MLEPIDHNASCRISTGNNRKFDMWNLFFCERVFLSFVGKYAQVTNHPENDGCINAVLLV